jgi:hypothetical protein
LPAGLGSDPQEWIEIDCFQPNLHEDLADRFVTLHTRSFRGRSYFRIFYKFPGGREALAEYLERLGETGVDWMRAAQNGFIQLKEDAPQIPPGTEAALVQYMMALDNQLNPTPTRIVESVRLRTYATIDGKDGDRTTNTGLGMNVYEYMLKRRLLFDDLNRGGLAREPMDEPQHRTIMQSDASPDWAGLDRPEILRDQCVSCHTGFGFGVHSLVSIVNMGGFDAGAQLGMAVALSAEDASPRGARAARFKKHDETWRRLLEYAELP